MNPIAPTKFLQLDGLFETLIGGQVTTAGNHWCMLPDGGRVPRGPWQHPLRPAGCAVRRRQAPPVLKRHAGLKDPRRPASLMHAYIVVNLMAGVRPEEARAMGGRRTSTWTAILPRSPYCARIGPGRHEDAEVSPRAEAGADGCRGTQGVAGGPVGFQNSTTGVELGFYAARSYSLRRPPRTGRRLMRSWERSTAG